MDNKKKSASARQDWQSSYDQAMGEERESRNRSGIAVKPLYTDEDWNDERYAAHHDLAAWTRFMGDAGFDAIGHYYRPPGLPREQQPWLASTWRKPAR